MLLSLLIPVMGCTTIHFPFQKSMPKATAANPVTQVVCLWQQSEGRDPDGLPCRGFAAQVLFLSSRDGTPVTAEGDVRIYLFDDQGTVEEQTKPLHQFNFNNGAWELHLINSKYLGPTYNVFVPYTRRGTTHAACALRIRFTPKSGIPIFSDLTNLPLNANAKPITGDDAKPITTEETEKLSAELAATKLRRTTTIAAGSQNSPKDFRPLSKDPLKSSPVQQAAYEVPGESRIETTENDRIQRLESIIQQMMRQQPQAATSSNGSSDFSHEPNPLPHDDCGSNQNPLPRRLRLKESQRVQSFDEDETARPTSRRRVHPLDDSQAASSRLIDNEPDGEDAYGEESPSMNSVPDFR